MGLFKSLKARRLLNTELINIWEHPLNCLDDMGELAEFVNKDVTARSSGCYLET